MTTVIVKFKYPGNLSRDQAIERMKIAAKMFENMDGLNSKQFTFDEKNQTFLTIYNWQNLEKQRHYSTTLLFLILKKGSAARPHLKFLIAS